MVKKKAGAKKTTGAKKQAGAALAAFGDLLVKQVMETKVQSARLKTKGDVIASWGKGMYVIPHSIRIDPQGNVWTTDANTSKVFKYTPEGKQLLTFEIGEIEFFRIGRRQFVAREIQLDAVQRLRAIAVVDVLETNDQHVFALRAQIEKGDIRVLWRASDVPALANQTSRVIIANSSPNLSEASTATISARGTITSRTFNSPKARRLASITRSCADRAGD